MGTSSPSSALLRRQDEGEGFTNDISTLLDQNRDDDTCSSLPSLNTTRVTFLCRDGEREKLHLILLLSASRLFRELARQDVFLPEEEAVISLPDVSSCELREAAEFLYGKKLKGNEESLHSGGAVECLRLGGWACNQEEKKSASALGTTTRVRIKEEEISSKPSLPPASDDSYWREMGEEEEEYNYGDDFQGHTLEEEDDDYGRYDEDEDQDFDVKKELLRQKGAPRTSSRNNVGRGSTRGRPRGRGGGGRGRKKRDENEEKRFKCPRCPRAFDYQKTLQRHLESHDAPPKRHECKICGQCFSNKFTLHYHKQKHDGAALTCTKCPRTFKSKKGLNYHMNLHEGVADFLCDDCGQGFITKQKLQNHRRAKHTFERPYICDVCGEGFTRSDKLVVHRRRAHTGEKPYMCDQCDWRGVDSSSLIHHKKRHGGAEARRKAAAAAAKTAAASGQLVEEVPSAAAPPPPPPEEEKRKEESVKSFMTALLANQESGINDAGVQNQQQQHQQQPPPLILTDPRFAVTSGAHFLAAAQPIHQAPEAATTATAPSAVTVPGMQMPQQQNFQQ